MKVLIACERNGKIRDAFLKLGHDAVSCDLVDTLVPGPHHKDDVTHILNNGWDLMIAHPDCTYLTGAGEWAFADEPMINGVPRKIKPGTLIGAERRQAREDALSFVRLLMSADIPRICIENPIGKIGTRIRRADQYIHPHEYGHDASKKTALWLKGLPKLVADPAQKIEPRWIADPKTGKQVARWANQTDSGQNKLPPSEDRAMLRAETYQGWADAMAKQWGTL